MLSWMNLFGAEHHAAEAAALAVDMLGRRIDHAIGAELERALPERGREHVVDGERRARVMRDLRHGGDIDHFQRRIGRCLHEERLGVGPHRLLPLIEIGAVDQRRGHAEARQQFLDHVETGAEQRARRDDVVAGLDLAHQRERHRRHPGRGRARILGALEIRHAGLEHAHGRIGEARILEARNLALEARLRLRRIVVDVALGEKQRFRRLVELRAQDSGLDEVRLGAVVALRHRWLPPDTKKPGQKTGPGTCVPGLFSDLFNVAASRPAQITTDRIWSYDAGEGGVKAWDRAPDAMQHATK